MTTVEEMVTVEQAAELIGMSQRYVRRLVAERRIPFHKLGRSVRIKTSDLSAHLEASRVEPITVSGVWAEMRRAA